MMLIDSNLIIYAVQAEHQNLREWMIDNQPSYSIISRVEVLGFARLQTIQKQALADLLKFQMDCKSARYQSIIIKPVHPTIH